MLTIAQMSSQLQLYEQMCALSNHMVEAARKNDWERLVNLERSVSALRDTLMEQENEATLTPQDAEKKRELIQRILKDDAEVRRHTEPWMEQLRRFLSGNVRKRQVDQAYGTGSAGL